VQDNNDAAAAALVLDVYTCNPAPRQCWLIKGIASLEQLVRHGRTLR
jgi:hypothetical protein